MEPAGLLYEGGCLGNRVGGGKRRDPPVASGEVRDRRLDAGYRYLAAAHAAALAAARCACAGGGGGGF